MKDTLIEIFRPNQSWSYRWFRIRELIGFPPYANEDKENREFIMKLFIIGRTLY